MDPYTTQAWLEMMAWQKQMQRKPSMINRFSKSIQTKLNSYIPEKVHLAITTVLKQMIKAVLFGAKHTTAKLQAYASLQQSEEMIVKKIDSYRKTAAVEGGITGAGGILMGFADFPILIGIKIKLLFEIASLYGFDVEDYKERIYLLHIFELAYSSQEHRRSVYQKIIDWKEKSNALPADINQFDWRSFQQEYRDYIDLAKMAQLIPAIGAPVGVLVNNNLVKKLGRTAMNAYRMRLIPG